MILKQSFAEFLRDRVNLNQSRLDRIKSAHWSVRNELEENDWIADLLVDTKLQGSYALGTAMRCPPGLRPYDVDVVLGLKLNDEWGALPNGMSVLIHVRDALEAVSLYTGKTEVRECCVRVAYSSDGLDFHLDVVPANVVNGMRDPLQIPRDWRESNPLGYIDWFKQANRDGSGHLRKVVRLLKYWRDLHQLESPNSMVLTTLAGHFIPKEALSTDDALVRVFDSMAAWAKGQAGWPTPSVPNPSLPKENLARDWRYDQFIVFRDSLITAHLDAKAARVSVDEEETISLWNSSHLFDGKFPTTVRGLGEAHRQATVAFAQGIITVGSNGGVGAPGITPHYNKGFYGDS